MSELLPEALERARRSDVVLGVVSGYLVMLTLTILLKGA